MKCISSVLLFAALATAQNQGKPADAAAPKTPESTVVELAIANGKFQTLVAAVKAAGLVETLSGKGPFTVFAPTDEAFAKLGQDTIQSLLKPENKAKLTAILTYHVVGDSLPASKVVAQKSLTTLQGSALAVSTGKDGVMVGEGKVLTTDIFGKNGVIHVVDTVLLPTDPSTDSIVAVARKAGAFGTLLQAAVAAGLADTLAKDGPFTVFAPTDEAFAKLPKETLASLLEPKNKAQLARILKFHVVAGTVPSTEAVKLSKATTLAGQDLVLAVQDGTLTVHGARVVSADVQAKNGVIHGIDTVLLPKD